MNLFQRRLLEHVQQFVLICKEACMTFRMEIRISVIGVPERAMCDVRNLRLINCRHQSSSETSREGYLEPSPR